MISVSTTKPFAPGLFIVFIIFLNISILNLVPRVLRLFDQRLVARRDSDLQFLLATNRWSKILRTLGTRLRIDMFKNIVKYLIYLVQIALLLL